MITRICCAHAGGQGKTTVAQTLYVAGRAMGTEMALAAADFIDGSGRSKLGRMYSDKVTELGTGPSVSAAKEANDLSAGVRYWDALGPLLLKGNVTMDIGANVVDQILNWGKIRRAPDLLRSRNAPPIDVFLVCKAERRAVDDMFDLVGRFGSSESLPVRRVYVVMNEQGGTFESLGMRETLMKIKMDADLRFVRLPRCMSELWVPMEQRYVSLEAALEMPEDKIVDSLGVDMWSVYSGMDDLRSWFAETREEFKRMDVM